MMAIAFVVGYSLIGILFGLWAASTWATSRGDHPFDTGLFFFFTAILWPFAAVAGSIWLIGRVIQRIAGRRV